MDATKWLEQWFADQCNREWEQTRGVSITTLDNPGWLVTIDLSGTSLEKHATAALLAVDGEPPSAENGNVGGESWMKCELRDTKFVGAGDQHRLAEIIARFKSWAESHSTQSIAIARPSSEIDTAPSIELVTTPSVARGTPGC